MVSNFMRIAALSSETFHYHDGVVVIVGEKEKGSFYYASTSLDKIMTQYAALLTLRIPISL